MSRMSRQRWQRQQRGRCPAAAVLAAAVTIGMVFTMTGYGVEGGISPVASIKQAFDAAMGKPLAERIVALEALEKQIDQGIADSTLAGKDKGDALYYKYHLQRHLAKYPDVYQTYAAYVQAIKDSGEMGRARRAFERSLDGWVRHKDFAFCASLCEVMAEGFSGDAEIRSAALYRQAWGKFWMNGTLRHAVGPLNTLIAEYPEGKWRAKAMRMLANAHYYLGEFDAAISTLGILEQEYPDTKLEHYADMRPASIWEDGQGQPEKALEIYQQTLKTYTDHMYAPYIHRQIKRIREVIEDQLIQDALQDLARGPSDKCMRKGLIVKARQETGAKVALVD